MLCGRSDTYRVRSEAGPDREYDGPCRADDDNSDTESFRQLAPSPDRPRSSSSDRRRWSLWDRGQLANGTTVVRVEDEERTTETTNT